jgi:PAS domain S-box-containing protein
MPDDGRADAPNGTGSEILDEVTLRALIEHVPATVYIDRLDETASNVYTSPRLEAELGYTVQEWVTDKDLYAKVLHPEDRERILAEYRRTRDTDEPFRAEYRMIARDGTVHWFHDEAAVIRDETGRPAYFHGFLLDITERKRAEEALRASEERFRGVTDAATDAIVSAGSDGRLRSWNRGAERMFGWRADEIVGRPLTVIMPERLRALHEQGLARVRQTGHSKLAGSVVELVALHKDGREFPVELSIGVWDSSDGPAFSGVIRDITEQKQLAEALRSSEEELRRQKQYVESLVEINPTAIVTVDRHGSVTSWNLAAEELFGYSRDEAIGRNLDDLVVGREDLRSEAVSYEEVLRAGRFHTITQRVRRDGTLADVELIIVPVMEKGEPTGYLVIYHDISELQRQKQYYQSLLEVSPTAIVTVDSDDRVTSWNPAAEKLFGYTRQEAIGQDVDSLVANSEAVHREAVQMNRQTREAGQVRLTTCRTRKDGSLVDVDVRAAPIRVGDQMVGLYALYHDISELQRAREQAEAATQAKSAFLAMMSHEIRTPMNAMIGMTGLLLDTELTPEQRSYAEVIRSSGEALMAIIDDILDFSKIEAGRLELESRPLDLRDCVESALEVVAASASSKGLDLAYFLEQALPGAIVGDATRLRQILINLLNNAVKFTDKGEVVLSVDGETLGSDDTAVGRKYQLHFAVRDSGIGIPEDRLSRLFESFSQIDASTTRRYGGTGLGLAISKRLSELMGGTIWVESQVGEGCTFHFTIQAEQAPGLAPAHKRGAPPQLHGRRVLIVDDNATNRHILVGQVGSWGMLARDTASPSQALEWVRRGDPFDLAILDMHMPEMDGVTLAEEIGRYRDARALPLVLLTSLGSWEELRGGVEFAASLTKPIKPSQLYDTLMSVFSPAPAGVQAPAPQEGPVERLAERVPLRILVAEDNAVNQQLVLLLLEKLGYQADMAADGLEALQALEREPYDVVLMDVQMPTMDGLEATRRIHQQWPEARRPHVIAATANAMREEREACLAAGMDDYLSKPIRLEELAAALSRCHRHLTPRPLTPARESGVGSRASLAESETPGQPVAGGVLQPAALERLMQTIGDDAELLPALIDTFLRDVPQLVDSARRGLQQGQADEVRRAAHTLKSNGATFGAMGLSELSRQLESLARSGTLEGTAELIARLEAEYEQVRIALEAVRERGGP